MKGRVAILANIGANLAKLLVNYAFLGTYNGPSRRDHKGLIRPLNGLIKGWPYDALNCLISMVLKGLKRLLGAL